MSELPVSDRVCEPDAGEDCTAAALVDVGAGAGPGPLPLQAVRVTPTAEVSAITARARWPARPGPRRPHALYGAGNLSATAYSLVFARAIRMALFRLGRLPAAPFVRTRHIVPSRVLDRCAGARSVCPRPLIVTSDERKLN